jgi:hypothetical protein
MLNLMLYNWLMLVNILVSTLGVLVFLFLFWKRLKEDYASEIIFKTASSIIIGILIGWGISFKFFPDLFFWTSLTGALVGLIFAILKFKVKFYESLETFILSSLPWLAFVFLEDSVGSSSLSSFLGFVAILILVFESFWLDTHYKSFTWYKSGRVGFAGLATAATAFLIRGLLAIKGVTMLSLVGRQEAAASGVVALTCFLLLFDLARRG